MSGDYFSVITGFLTSFLASALCEAAKKYDNLKHSLHDENKKKLYKALSLARPNQETFELAIAQAFREISPIKAYNRFSIFFSDIEFRQLLLKWMLTITPTEKEITLKSMESRASYVLKSPELGKEATSVISTAFEGVVLSNNLLNEICSRHDHEQILETIQSVAHLIQVQPDNISEKFNTILNSISCLQQTQISSIELDIQRICCYTDNILKKSDFEIPIIGAIDRIEQKQVLEFVLMNDCVLLYGEAGAGKTGVLTKLTFELRKINECVLLIKADIFARMYDTRCTIDDLSRGLGFDIQIADMLERIAEKIGRIWLIVDQLDQVDTEAVGAAFIQLLNRIKGRPGCKVIIACRSYEAKAKAFVGSLGLPELVIGELPPEIVCECFRRLQINPEIRITGFCRNILNLFLLASLVNERTSVNELTAEGQLWNKLRERLSNDDQAGLVEAACDFAIEAVKSEGGKFFINSVMQECAKRLSSWGILNANYGGVFAFRHERLRDFFIAYNAVIRSNMNLSGLLSSIPNKARVKTVLPWMLQIAAEIKPEYIVDLINDIYNKITTPSNFPRRAFVDSIEMIQNPTIPMALALWRAAVELEKEPSDEFGIPLGISSPWAFVFWNAGLFDAAVRTSFDYPYWRQQEPGYRLLEQLQVIAKQFPKEVNDWISDLTVKPPNLEAIAKALLECPIEIIDPALKKLIIWIKASRDEDISDTEIRQLIERLATSGKWDLAVSLFEVSTEPIIWESRPVPPHIPERHIRMKCHMMFMMVIHSEKEQQKTIFGVPCDLLVPIFREHEKKAMKLAKEAGYEDVGDEYTFWGSLGNFSGPGVTDGHKEWRLWYGLLRIVSQGALKSKPEKAFQLIAELISSSDFLEVRIGLELLGNQKRFSESLIRIIKSKRIFCVPSALGESILVFSKLFISAKEEYFIQLTTDIEIAIKNLDHDRPEFFNIHYRLPDRFIQWIMRMALWESPEKKQNATDSIADFIFAITNCTDKKLRWTFRELAKCCSILTEVGVRPSGFVTGSHGKRFYDAIGEWVSLDSAGDKISRIISANFHSLWNSAYQTSKDWIETPIGYAVLVALQTRTPRKKGDSEYRFRIPNKKIISQIILAYTPIIVSISKYAQGIRSQFAGLLGMWISEMKLKDIREFSPVIRTVLMELCKSREGGVVSSNGIFNLTFHLPLSVAAKSIHSLLKLNWRDRFDDSDPDDELIRMATHISEEQKELADEPRSLILNECETIENAYNTIGDHQVDVIRILGYNIISLAVLDVELFDRLVLFLYKADLLLCEVFVQQATRSFYSWLLYPSLKVLFKRLMDQNQEKTEISHGMTSDIATVTLIGFEDLNNNDSLLFRLLTNMNHESRKETMEIVCDAFDKLGGRPDHWIKVKKLWQDAVQRSKNEQTKETAAFWRCFEKGQRSWNTKDEEIGLRVPENLTTLAELLESTCIALSSKPSYQNKERNAVIRYLADQSVGQEILAVRLLSLCIGLHNDNFDKITIHYEPALTILRNAIIAGGEAKKTAIKIIEKNELISGEESLAGLLM